MTNEPPRAVEPPRAMPWREARALLHAAIRNAMLAEGMTDVQRASLATTRALDAFEAVELR